MFSPSGFSPRHLLTSAVYKAGGLWFHLEKLSEISLSFLTDCVFVSSVNFSGARQVTVNTVGGALSRGAPSIVTALTAATEERPATAVSILFMLSWFVKVLSRKWKILSMALKNKTLIVKSSCSRTLPYVQQQITSNAVYQTVFRKCNRLLCVLMFHACLYTLAQNRKHNLFPSGSSVKHCITCHLGKKEKSNAHNWSLVSGRHVSTSGPTYVNSDLLSLYIIIILLLECYYYAIRTIETFNYMEFEMKTGEKTEAQFCQCSLQIPRLV